MRDVFFDRLDLGFGAAFVGEHLFDDGGGAARLDGVVLRLFRQPDLSLAKLFEQRRLLDRFQPLVPDV